MTPNREEPKKMPDTNTKASGSRVRTTTTEITIFSSSSSSISEGSTPTPRPKVSCSQRTVPETPSIYEELNDSTKLPTPIIEIAAITPERIISEHPPNASWPQGTIPETPPLYGDRLDSTERLPSTERRTPRPRPHVSYSQRETPETPLIYGVPDDNRLDFPPPTIEIEVLVPATPQITPEPDDLISEPDSTPSRPRPRARMPTSPPTPSPLEARRTRSRNVQSSAKHQAAGNKKNKAPPKWARKRTLRNRGGAGTAVPAAAPVGPTRPARRAAATLPPRTRYARGARFEGSYNEVDLAKRKRG